jgi:hypothetical protein
MHPSKSTLALYAGDDLGLWARLRLSVHMHGCEECQRRVGKFRTVREWVRQEGEAMPPAVDWNVLAGELKANIRVGLAAGRCVGPVGGPAPVLHWRPAAMAIPVLVVVLASWLLQSLPQPLLSHRSAAGVVLEASPNGIGVRQGGRGFTLLHPRAEDVSFSVSGPSAVGARYVDGETGYVMVSHVYAQ